MVFHSERSSILKNYFYKIYIIPLWLSDTILIYLKYLLYNNIVVLSPPYICLIFY